MGVIHGMAYFGILPQSVFSFFAHFVFRIAPITHRIVRTSQEKCQCNTSHTHITTAKHTHSLSMGAKEQSQSNESFFPIIIIIIIIL